MVVEEVVDEVDDDGLVVVVVDPARVVVVDDGRVVVVERVLEVDDDGFIGSSPPFRSPYGSPAPDAGRPPRVVGAHAGQSTFFCLVAST